MKRIAVLLVAATIVAPAHMALASASVGFERGSAARELPPYLQCVPYARQLTGIQIFGDAHTWWGQAAGKYERGRAPKVGAEALGAARLGVAAASCTRSSLAFCP